MARYITIPVDDIDLSMGELAEMLSDEQWSELCRLKGTANGPEPGKGKGDPPESRYIEDAYLFALGMPDVPQAFRDLLWHVHGRAI